jgi:hypothetical protein
MTPVLMPYFAAALRHTVCARALDAVIVTLEKIRMH